MDETKAIRDVLLLCVLVGAGIIFGAFHCAAGERAARLECIKAGRPVAECGQFFHP